MSLLWLWTLAACALAISHADRSTSGSSLRSALEALQRRQRGRGHALPDYDAFYDYAAPEAYLDSDYNIDFDDEGPEPYLVKLLNEKEKPQEAYEYKIIKKSFRGPVEKSSPFRERSHHNDNNDRLKDLFSDRSDSEGKDLKQLRDESEEEYEELLRQLWSKYKNNKHGMNNPEVPQGIVKLYKDKYIRKRYPYNWGPIAFKKKRSSGNEPQSGRKPHGDGMALDPNYNSYDLTDEDKNDIREEYAIAFQPLDDDESLPDLVDDERNNYDDIEKRFPVSKRSAAPFDINHQSKRQIESHNRKESMKTFRSSSGTDPKTLKELSKIFGQSDHNLIKHPVKRSSANDKKPHDDYKPPQVTLLSHENDTHSHNVSNVADDNSHEKHGHIHHPGMESQEEILQPIYENTEKPLTIRKKSIKWSDYFGIDRRRKKSRGYVTNVNQDRFRKQYLDTFNNEVILPLHSFGKHKQVKRNSINSNLQKRAIAQKKKRDVQESETKLDDIDKKLRNMEGLIVDEALHLSEAGEELDTKEEQEIKEKLLSKMAAAHSLEKMRKAIKEFKQSLRLQNHNTGSENKPTNAAKVKRVAIKKEKVESMNTEIPKIGRTADNNDDFEDEQGAGHYLDGNMDRQLSEGYMGGSGRHRVPIISTAEPVGSCPELNKIIQRCRGVDMLAGDRGQLFLPLCSLHQICYLCGEAQPTTCDLVFLSEADTTCDGDIGCQQAARGVLMTLRDLHENLTDELDGECDASPCLPATLKLNSNWQRALQR